MIKSLTRAEYDAVDAVNFSTLKEARKSLLHYRYRLDHPLKDSPRLALGRAVHSVILEPKDFNQQYAVWSGARKEGEKWKSFLDAHVGMTILTTQEYATVQAIATAIRAHSVAGAIFNSPGEAEKSIIWTDNRTGLQCKGRPDWIYSGGVVDLKTAYNIDSRQFAAAVAQYGYHVQAAFYLEGLARSEDDFELPYRPYYLVAVESAPPHDVAVYRLDDDTLYAGAEEMWDLLEKVSSGRFTKAWPGRYPEVQTLQLPKWCFPEDVDVSSYLEQIGN